jgi:hypothetical protein
MTAEQVLSAGMVALLAIVGCRLGLPEDPPVRTEVEHGQLVRSLVAPHRCSAG